MGEGPSRLHLLEKRLRRAARVERFLKPSVEMYRLLLRDRWNINTEGQDHENAVTASVNANDVEAVRFLIEHGGRVTDGALQYSLAPTDPPMTRLLFDSLDGERKASAMGPLLIAAAHNTPDVVRFLLAAGANVNWRAGYNGETPLMAAVDGGSLETARLLLAAGADVQITDDSGRSALWRAAAVQHRLHHDAGGPWRRD